MKLNRVIATIFAAALVGTALTGCSSAGGTSSSAASCAASGDLSNAVTATGTPGEALASDAVSFPTPMVSTSTQVSTLVAGTGAALTEESGWLVAFTIFQGDSTTAKGSYGYASASTSSSSSESPLAVQPSGWASSWPGFATALSCGHVGDRIAVVMGTTDNASAASGLGLSTDSSIVMVIDVLDGFSARATGDSAGVASTFPVVTLATDGQPGISTPKGDAPTATTIGVLRTGTGQSVGASDTAIVQYSGWLWSDGTQFDTSWGTGRLLTTSKSGVISGFWKAIEGQSVGSQVIVVIPPKDGYGDTANSSIPANSTLVFVIDILAVTK